MNPTLKTPKKKHPPVIILPNNNTESVTLHSDTKKEKICGICHNCLYNCDPSHKHGRKLKCEAVTSLENASVYSLKDTKN
jgi:flavoprotein